MGGEDFVAASATNEAAGSSADALVAMMHPGSPCCLRVDPHTAWSLLERAGQKQMSGCSFVSAVDNQPSSLVDSSSCWIASRESLAIDKLLAVLSSCLATQSCYGSINTLSIGDVCMCGAQVARREGLSSL